MPKQRVTVNGNSQLVDVKKLPVDEVGKPLTTLLDDGNGVYQPDISTIAKDAYIEEYKRIDEKRRSLYSQMADPLEMEARRLRRHGQETEALVLEKQADAAVAKIKAENPWPVNPNA